VRRGWGGQMKRKRASAASNTPIPPAATLSHHDHNIRGRAPGPGGEQGGGGQGGAAVHCVQMPPHKSDDDARRKRRKETEGVPVTLRWEGSAGCSSAGGCPGARGKRRCGRTRPFRSSPLRFLSFCRLSLPPAHCKFFFAAKQKKKLSFRRHHPTNGHARRQSAGPVRPPARQRVRLHGRAGMRVRECLWVVCLPARLFFFVCA
jgi:hypothetical protein